jgi:sirohydrochlorin ferrochelatase
MSRILLIDNGSSRPDSTLTLRRLADALGERLGRPVAPVSLQHSHKVPAHALGGRPADTLGSYLRRAATEGERDFLSVPLFFGPSRALSRFVPETAASLAPEVGEIRVRIARELCPLPPGEPRLGTILADQIRVAAHGMCAPRLVLVDHGSPIPEVTAVRHWVATWLEGHLGTAIHQAVMERRQGTEYDFNGRLLSEVLEHLAEQDPRAPVVVALLFIAPGRHAGPGGDIADIVAGAERRNPGLGVSLTPLVSAHQELVDILADRALEAGLNGPGAGYRPGGSGGSGR